MAWIFKGDDSSTDTCNYLLTMRKRSVPENCVVAATFKTHDGWLWFFVTNPSA